MLREFWSDIKNVERASAEDIQSDVLAYLGTIEELTGRIETTERQRDEAVKALEKLKEDNSPGDFYYGGIYDEVSEALERIKGAAQAEGHQSTESAQAQAGGRIGLGGSHE